MKQRHGEPFVAAEGYLWVLGRGEHAVSYARRHCAALDLVVEAGWMDESR
jgi:hypothetical protein